LSPDTQILSDDLTLVMNDDHGVPRAGSIPFRGALAPHYTSIESYPVAGFFRLVQHPGDSLERLTGARAVGESIGSLPFVTERPEMAGEVLDRVSSACASVPVYQLRFTKSRAFWKTLGDAGLCAPIDSFSHVRGMKS